MRIRAPDGGEAAGHFLATHGYRGFRDEGLAIRRTVLDALLLDRARAAGVRVQEHTSVRDVITDGATRVAGVTVATPGGGAATLRAPLVIGADGLRSVVARRTGLGRYGRWPRRMALVTHYRGVSGMETVGEMRVHADRYIGLAPVGGGLINVAVVVPVSRSRPMAGDAARFLDRELSHDPDVVRRLASAERVTPVTAVGAFNWRARVGWRPGVALVGDAADFYDPFTGEGIYTALRGGELLALYAVEAVTARSARQADVALAAYDRARGHEFRGKWRVERAIGAIVGVPPLMNRAIRALGQRPDLADLLVGVTGDFVPAGRVLEPAYILRLLRAAVSSPGAGRRVTRHEPRVTTPESR
jgi:flavin-dependent dehydrogenase